MPFKNRFIIPFEMILLFFVGMGGASGAVDPTTLFQAQEIYGVGGNDDFVESSFSVLCRVVNAKASDFDGDGFIDLILVSDGRMAQGSYAGMAPSAYLYLGGADIDDCPTYDVSPNVWAGGDSLGSTNFSFSPWGVSNKRGYPPAHSTYGGSDLAWLRNMGDGFFVLDFITANGPAWVYGARQVQVGDLDGIAPPRPEVVVFSDHGPVDTTLGDSTIMRYKFLPGFNIFSQAVVSKRLDAHAQPTPRAGFLANLDGVTGTDILVGNHNNSPYLYWYKNDGTGNILDAHFQPVNVPDADIANPAVLWAGNFTNDGFADILVGRDGVGANSRLTLLQGTDATGTNYVVKHIVGAPWAVGAFAVGDINGDGLLDVVAGRDPSSGAFPSPVTIFFSQAGFNSWTPQPLPRGGDFNGILLDLQMGDLNNDGKIDIVALFSNGGPSDTDYRLRGLSSNVHAWINRNTGGSTNLWDDFGLAEPALPATALGSTGGSVVIEDFDKDNDNDVFRVAENCPAVLFENAWNTQRHFRIRATTGRGKNRQTTTTFIGVDPLGNKRSPVAETTGGP